MVAKRAQHVTLNNVARCGMLRSFGRGLWPGSKAFTGENNLLVVFLKAHMTMEPDLAHI